MRDGRVCLDGRVWMELLYVWCMSRRALWWDQERVGAAVWGGTVPQELTYS